jgi:hypothetical protein
MAVIRTFEIDYEPDTAENAEQFQVEAIVEIHDQAETVEVVIGQVDIWVQPIRPNVSPWVEIMHPLPEWLETELRDQVLDILRSDGAEYDATLAAQEVLDELRAREAQAGL